MFSILCMGDRPIDRLLRRAEALQMNQRQLADALDVRPQHVTNWKARGMPAAMHAAAAKVVRMSIEELAEGTPANEYRQAHELSHQGFDTPPAMSLEDLMHGANYPESFTAEVPDGAVAPEFPAGLRLVWSTTKAPQVGSLVIVRNRHGLVAVRQYRQGREPGRWIAAATADAFASFDSIDDGLQVLAVAAWRPMP